MTSSFPSGEISTAQLSPPPGFGLYVYELPGRKIDAETLDAIAEFHWCELGTPRNYDSKNATALMILPVHETYGHRVAGNIDLSLADDLLPSATANPEVTDVCVVAIIRR